jgi:hypothetical protein
MTMPDNTIYSNRYDITPSLEGPMTLDRHYMALTKQAIARESEQWSEPDRNSQSGSWGIPPLRMT